ncbi:CocE/NonD family hydrolase [Polymorphospora sp. NPDC050346]|uniref:CocE/NonD family hydrolase n=1 Tax=Polymorphospora sp. NPDC050346 TaxID=3155780 RepID=UPI0033F69CE7
MTDSDREPSARYRVRVVRDVRIPTDDPAVTLAGDLFLPDGAGPVPALVSVLPYRKDGLGGIGGWASYHWFAERGYASLLVDFRGTGSSDGEPRPPFDPAEADDGVRAVGWAAAQPWCDGTVGMWGVSYGAVMSLRTAARRPPALKAIIPVLGMIDPGYDFVHPHGARGCLGSLGMWGLSTLLSQLLPPLHGHDTVDEQRRWRRRLEHAEPYLLDLHRHGPGDPVWRERAVDPAAVGVPAFCVAGWRDLFCDGSIRAFEQLPGPKKLLAGPWMHTPPHESPFEPVDFHTLALRWWDRWLRGVDAGTGDEPAATVFVQGRPDPAAHDSATGSPVTDGPAGRSAWRAYESWPPPAKELALAGTPGGGLGPATDTGHDPGAPVLGTVRPDPTVGALSGLWGVPTTGFGLPLDQHDDDLRALAFTGEPLTAPVLIAGRPVVTVEVAGAAGDLVVKLTDVDPDGRSTLITAGRAGAPPGPAGDAGPAPAGGPVRVVLVPTAYRLPAGHRLRVVVGGTDFPRHWPGAPTQTRLTRLALAVPVVSETEGTPVTPPVPGPPPAGTASLHLRGTPRWDVTRDLIRDGVTVTVGEDVAAYAPQRQHVLEVCSTIAASAQRDHPAAAQVRATSTATARMSTGETVVVEVGVHVTADSAGATGRVTVDGVETFARRWTA